MPNCGGRSRLQDIALEEIIMILKIHVSILTEQCGLTLGNESEARRCDSHIVIANG